MNLEVPRDDLLSFSEFCPTLHTCDVLFIWRKTAFLSGHRFAGKTLVLQVTSV